MTHADAVEILSKPWCFRHGDCLDALEVVRAGR